MGGRRVGGYAVVATRGKEGAGDGEGAGGQFSEDGTDSGYESEGQEVRGERHKGSPYGCHQPHHRHEVSTAPDPNASQETHKKNNYRTCPTTHLCEAGKPQENVV